MLPLIVDFTNLSLSALLVGAMFCGWLIFNPAHLDAAQYIVIQKQGIRTLHPILPLLGGLTIAATLFAAFLARENKPRMSLLIAAAILFTAAGMITRFANMPINAKVMQWSIASPPQQWTELRDSWWLWHRRRTASAVTANILLIAATLLRSQASLPGSALLIIYRPLVSALLRGISLLL
jgi:hypothetical protein